MSGMAALLFRFLTIILYLDLGACFMVGPDYKEPPKKVTTHWQNPGKRVNDSAIHNENWWRVFHDPALTALINEGYHHNLNLQSAAAHVLQTRAQLAQSVGDLYPQQQQMLGNLTNQRIGGQSLQNILPSTFNTAALGFSANWEIDFWGKYRRAILANDATFLSAFAAYDNVLVTLTADIATTYINVRTTEELIRVIKKNIAVQSYILKIAKARFNAGETSLLDAQQALTELSQTQASLPQQLSNLQQQKDLLAVLIGTTPDKIDALLVKTKGIPIAPPKVAVGIPTETLAKRPDVYQARLEAIAQSEEIGAIKAQLYPSFSLTGNFVFASNNINNNSLGNLFTWSNRAYSAGPTFSWPLLNYGQITNSVRQQDAAFQQSILKYMNVVLSAQQEVQDNITLFIQTHDAKKYLTTANNSAIKSTHLAIVRYTEGQSDFTPVLDSERQQIQVQTSLVTAQGSVPKALVSLYRSLGGGWQIRGCDDIVSNQMKRDMAKRTNWGDLLKQENHQPPNTKYKQLEELYLPNW